MENRHDGGTSVPGWTPEFGIRLAEVIGVVGGLSAAAEIGDVTYETLGKWRDGKARPALFAVSKICQAGGKSLDWLLGIDIPRCESDAPSQPDLRAPTLAAVAAEATMDWLDANRLELSRPLTARLIGKALQALLALSGGTQEELRAEVARVLDEGLGLLRSGG